MDVCVYVGACIRATCMNLTKYQRDKILQEIDFKIAFQHSIIFLNESFIFKNYFRDSSKDGCISTNDTSTEQSENS